jgi:3'-phosphoadenosine 5'-phosphosulfate sulfotransferase (PAPS reductase)/FAD synthetase
VVSYQELRAVVWPGTKELVKRQADLFGLETYYVKRRNQHGYEETLLEYVERRGMWPSKQQRYCTSDFKRGPGARVVTALSKGKKGMRVLYVFGFRKQESSDRAKKQVLSRNTRLTTLTRTVDEYLPIHKWSLKKVWATIHKHDLPYHPAYDLGMSRFSCCFCILSSRSDLCISAKANPELLQQYVAVENKIGHTFQPGFALRQLQEGGAGL